MAISTNGTVLARLAGALYNTQMSNATYSEVKTLDPATLADALYARDFSSSTDAAVANTLVTNLGLSSITGLNNWVAAQLTAAGSHKGAKIVDLLNGFAQMTADATYGAYATAFNATVDAALALSQTTGNAGGTFAAAGAPVNATFTLTTGVDTFTGGAGNDTFNAIATGFTAGDVLNGGAGTDTLAITDNLAAMGVAAPTATVTGIEKLTISTTGGLGVAAVAGTTAVKQVNTYVFGTPNAPTDTLVVNYGNQSSTIVTGADATAEGDAFAAAVNNAAGQAIAVNTAGTVVVTAPTAGVALPAITFGAATKAVDIPATTFTKANVVGVASVTAAAYDVSGISSLTDNTVTAAGAINLKSSATANVTATTTSGKVTLDGGLTQKATAVGGYAISGGKGAITVTDTAQAAVASTIDGGTSVTLTSTAKNAGGTTGTITVGGTTAPIGVVSVTSNISGAAAAATNTAGGAIAVTGGTSVTVTQNATQAAMATASTNSTITQAAVTVTGKATTTDVTVNNTAVATAADTVLAVAGVTEVNTLTFAALTSGQTQIINGLTFTAGSAGTTAAETAAAFANLTSGDTQGNSTKGTYSGAFSTAGWTSGAVTGTSTVTFTATTSGTRTDLADSGTGTDPTVVVTTDGVAAVTAAGKGGVTANTITINDAVTSNTATTASTITSITASNYTTLTIDDNALSTLNLTGGSGNVTIDNTSSRTAPTTTLNLSLNGVTGGTLDDADVYTTLNVATTGADSTLANITDTALATLAISGTQALTLTSAAGMTGLKTVTVSGSAGLSADLSALVTGGSFNASGTSGANTITVKATVATYTGGTGADKVTTTTDGVSKAISLGDGDDTLTIGDGITTLTAAVSGGNGSDTLVMRSADAATAATDAGFVNNLSGFEKLTVTTGGGSVDVSKFGPGNDITLTATASTTIDHVAANAKVTINGAQAGTLTVTGADVTGTADVLNVVQSNATGGTLAAAGYETIALTSSVASGALTITDTALKTLTIGGTKSTTVTLSGTTLATTIDASANTGGVTITSVSTAAATITGGSGDDALTAKSGTTAETLIGNGGADTLTSNAGLTTLTGGAGNDIFVVTANTANIGVYTTITDFAAGDLLKLANKGTESFVTTKISLADTATFQDYLNAASTGDGSSNGIISWFQYNGNTYVVEDMTAGATYTIATDLVVKLTGLVDLSVASINTGSGPTISL